MRITTADLYVRCFLSFDNSEFLRMDARAAFLKKQLARHARFLKKIP